MHWSVRPAVLGGMRPRGSDRPSHATCRPTTGRIDPARSDSRALIFSLVGRVYNERERAAPTREGSYGHAQICHSDASTTSGSSSATPGSRRTSIATPSASTSSPTPAWRRGVQARGGLRARARGTSPSSSSSPLSCRASRQRRGSSSTATASQTSPSTSTTCRPAYETAVRRGADGRDAADPRWRTSTASTSSPRSGPTATRPTPSSTATATAASSLPASSRSTPSATAPRTFHPVGLKAIDHIVGQRRGRARWTSGSSSTQDVLGFSPARHLRRQGHQHRVFGPDVEGGAERHRAASSSRSTSRPRRGGGRRSRNT